MSGAIYRLDWYESDDPPIASIHGDQDGTVPYAYGWVNTFGNDVIKLYGSQSIHPHLDELGVSNTLITVPGGGHTDIYFDLAFEAMINQFFDEEIIDLFVDDLCQ